MRFLQWCVLEFNLTTQIILDESLENKFNSGSQCLYRENLLACSPPHIGHDVRIAGSFYILNATLRNIHNWTVHSVIRPAPLEPQNKPFYQNTCALNTTMSWVQPPCWCPTLAQQHGGLSLAARNKADLFSTLILLYILRLEDIQIISRRETFKFTHKHRF